MSDGDGEQVRRRYRKRGIALALLAVLLLALVALWTQRFSIADDLVARELQRRGVRGSYDITQVGPRTQRLENLVIGDPANPDLTAAWAEVYVRLRFGAPRVTGVRAHGVRLKGRLVDGVFSFGEVDELLPPPTGKPFTLPDLDLALTDAQARLALPNGPVGLTLAGEGNLTDGFAGTLAAAAPRLDVEGCRLTGMTATLDLGIAARRPAVNGPVRAASMACPAAGLALAGARADVAARFAEALNRWQGTARLAVASARLGGDRLAGVGGQATFAGGRADTRGKLDLTANRLAAQGLAGSGARLVGAYQLGGTDRGFKIGLGGKGSVARAAIEARLLASLTSFDSGGRGTPVGPLATALAEALRRAGRDLTASADFTFAQLGAVGSLQISALDARSRSGARLALAGDGIRYAWPGARGAQVDGALTLSGGGLPATDIALAQARPGAPIEGVATIAPYAAGGARLALAPLRFGPAGGGTRFSSRIMLDGPLGDGRVTGLTLPVAGRFGGERFVLNPGCAPLAWRSLSISGLVLDPARLTLCPLGNSGLTGGARVASPRVSGRLGGTPIFIAADGARYALGSSSFAADGVGVRLGAPGSVSRLDLASLTGDVSGRGVTGRFAGASGQIARVPLLVSQGTGGWSLGDGALLLNGGLHVADEMPEPRFYPLISNDFALSLIDNRIAAGGTLREPKTNQAVTSVTIAHNLRAGAGSAVLDVNDLRFSEALQPDALTRLALGVVANVRGSVSGRGNIRWSSAGVASDGVFRTENADLAAAFGPVTALSTEIRFTDLLGLQTAPGQRATIGALNPGIAVLNGYVDYQLLPGQRVRIEGGRWPLAGGELILDPTILDLGQATERRLTFRLSGLDIAQFVTQLDVKDVNATGVLDGVIPMVFDATGGRIEGGRLTARAGGGTLAYVGEISSADLGIWGDIAFDALKSIAFENLTIGLDGDIDGEMVTQIRFDGVSRGTIEPVATGLIAAIGGQVASQVQRLPFRFNIRISGPFRQLLGTARGIYDPNVLIERNLPELLRQQRERERTRGVQPSESEDVR